MESAALDEAILSAHAAGHAPDTLHFYVRAAPTVSVGYFQKIAGSLDLDECRKRNVWTIRRRSGGSSIYTDRNQLIYAVVMREKELPEDRLESFRAVCGPVARAISSLGVEATYRPMNDVEIGGKKVSGSAQLRHKGSVLQHGTVILDLDPETMDAVLRLPASSELSRPSDRVTTLAAALGSKPDTAIVKARIADEIAAGFSASLAPGRMTKQERSTVHELIRERYSREEWNFRF